MLNKIKIGPKLIGGFLIVAAIAGVIGTIGIINMKKIDAADTMLYQKMTVPLSLLSDISTAFQRIRINSRDLLRAQDNADMEKCIKTIEDLNSEMDKKMDDYEKLIITDDMKQMAAKFRESQETYRKDLDKIIALARANKDAEGYATLDGSGKENAFTAQAAIDKMQEKKNNDAKSTSENNTKSANAATAIMLVSLILGVILAIVLGVFLTFSITRPVNTVVTTARKLAEEDLVSLTEILTAASIGDLSK